MNYLKLLYARIGKTISPISGEEVKKHTVSDVVNHIMSFPEGTKLLLLAPVHIPEERSVVQTLQLLSQQGYARIRYQGEIVRIDSITSELDHDFQLVVDRIITQTDEDFIHRLADASDTASLKEKDSVLLKKWKAENKRISAIVLN